MNRYSVHLIKDKMSFSVVTHCDQINTSSNNSNNLISYLKILSPRKWPQGGKNKMMKQTHVKGA